MTRRSLPTLLTTIPFCTASLLLAPFSLADEERRLPAEAGDFTLKIEPGVAVPLNTPQTQLFNVGAGETIKALWTLNEYFDIGPSATFIALPSSVEPNEVGTAWTFGAGARFKRPHHMPGGAAQALSPWLDVDALYVRTGGLDRPGFAAAVGLSVPIDDARSFWIGPFIRYLEIIQGNRVGFNNDDARILSLGVSLEVGTAVRRVPEVEADFSEPKSEPRRATEAVQVASCPDRDDDRIPDSVDRCPDVAGTADNWGCPAYQKIIIHADKLELKEKLYFAWDQATLQEVSFPVLDEVVQALNDNKNFRVQVEGHASAEGNDDHNQTLSEKRADAVLDYLVTHGISKERLVSKGFSSSVPIDTNETTEGRESNRRVEFVVNFIILSEDKE